MGFSPLAEARAFLSASLVNPVGRVRTESPHAQRRRRIVVAATMVAGAYYLVWSGLYGILAVAATATSADLAASSTDLARRGAAAGPGKAVGLGLYAACALATALSGEIARRNPGVR